MKNDGNEISDQKGILDEVKEYHELYSFQDVSDIDIQAEFPDAPVLTNEDSESIEGLITYQKAVAALKKMEHFKSPGPDGFTEDF